MKWEAPGFWARKPAQKPTNYSAAEKATGWLLVRANPLISLVGAAGFELATPCTPFNK